MFKKYHLDLTKLTYAIDNKQLPSIADIKVETPVMDSKLSLYNYLIDAGVVHDRYIEACGFSIITKELIEEMATLLKGRRIIEIGCGNGYLAQSFKQCYPDVTYETLDSDKWEWVHRHISIDHTTNYGEFDFSEYGAVIVSWPDLDCEDIGKALASLPTGCLLLHCGEGRGGCTFVNKDAMLGNIKLRINDVPIHVSHMFTSELIRTKGEPITVDISRDVEELKHVHFKVTIIAEAECAKFVDIVRVKPGDQLCINLDTPFRLMFEPIYSTIRNQLAHCVALVSKGNVVEH